MTNNDTATFDDTIRSGYEKCTGCGVCTLTCPVWCQTSDVMLTVSGRTRVLQGGGTPADIRESLLACVLCGACASACPAGVDTVALTTELRMRLGTEKKRAPRSLMFAPGKTAPLPGDRATGGHRNSGFPHAGKVFFPGAALRENDKLFKRTRGLIEQDGFKVFDDTGLSAMSVEMEAGIRPDPEQLKTFIRSMSGVTEIVAMDGFLHRHLRQWLSGARVIGLGEALLGRADIKRALKTADLYVIEARGYHSDHTRLVKVYDRMRQETGCKLNTSLQRAAIPTGATARPGPKLVDTAAQARWILEKRRPNRIVTEAMEDLALFKKMSGPEVIHVSELV